MKQTRLLALGTKVPLLFLSLLLALPACHREEENTVSLAPVPENRILEATSCFPAGLCDFMQVPDGDSTWRWFTSADKSSLPAPATLSILGPRVAWKLIPATTSSPTPDTCSTIILEADDTGCWHTMLIYDPGSAASLDWLPLRRMQVESSAYDNLLELLQDLTTPRFDQIVRHWRHSIIPVRASEAWTGGLELSSCLREAMDIWNEGQNEVLFRWDPDAAWGVRFVHYPGVQLEPTLYVQATRLENNGTPRIIQIRAGDNYADSRHRRYAVRGMAHELGHCLFLWGHTRDRIHLLWGSAPPLVDQPSADERQCVTFWRLLPAGLDLSRYQ